MKCRYGKLKNPVGSRVCKKKPGCKKSKSSRSTASKAKCKHGKLKNPVGRRVCKKAPRGRK